MENIDLNYKDIIQRRTDFPSLGRTHNGYPLAYLDGPGGTQVSQQVIDAIVKYYKTGLLDELKADRLRTQIQHSPYIIETGTLNHAALAGVKAAVEYIASFGTGSDFRTNVVTAMQRIYSYEHKLAHYLYEGLRGITRVTIYGPSFNELKRAPTVSFTLDGYTPPEICSFLNEKGICVWDRHFYAIRSVEVLGLMNKGGLTRAGISLYNTQEEIDRLLEEIRKIIKAQTK